MGSVQYAASSSDPILPAKPRTKQQYAHRMSRQDLDEDRDYEPPVKASGGDEGDSSSSGEDGESGGVGGDGGVQVTFEGRDAEKARDREKDREREGVPRKPVGSGSGRKKRKGRK